MLRAAAILHTAFVLIGNILKHERFTARCLQRCCTGLFVTFVSSKHQFGTTLTIIMVLHLILIVIDILFRRVIVIAVLFRNMNHRLRLQLSL